MSFFWNEQATTSKTGWTQTRRRIISAQQSNHWNSAPSAELKGFVHQSSTITIEPECRLVSWWKKQADSTKKPPEDAALADPRPAFLRLLRHPTRIRMPLQLMTTDRKAWQELRLPRGHLARHSVCTAKQKTRIKRTDSPTPAWARQTRVRPRAYPPRNSPISISSKPLDLRSIEGSGTVMVHEIRPPTSHAHLRADDEAVST